MARQRNPLPIPKMECPLGDEHCHNLNETLRSCADLGCYLDKLESIGLDVSEWRNESNGNARMAEGIKRIHFPDRA